MVADLLAWLIRVLVGVSVRARDLSVFAGPKVFFANHTSHLDFLVIWASMPSAARRRCVPVAARDYWERGLVRPRLARACRALLIDRHPVAPEDDPIGPMSEAVRGGASLIVFPEGTRSLDGAMQPFKGGLYHLAKRSPGIEFVPVRIENLNRILPKGEVLPVPLLCRVAFGGAMTLGDDEPRDAFLARAREAVEELGIHEN